MPGQWERRRQAPFATFIITRNSPLFILGWSHFFLQCYKCHCLIEMHRARWRRWAHAFKRLLYIWFYRSFPCRRDDTFWKRMLWGIWAMQMMGRQLRCLGSLVLSLHLWGSVNTALNCPYFKYMPATWYCWLGNDQEEIDKRLFCSLFRRDKDFF